MTQITFNIEDERNDYGEIHRKVIPFIAVNIGELNEFRQKLVPYNVAISPNNPNFNNKYYLDAVLKRIVQQALEGALEAIENIGERNIR